MRLSGQTQIFLRRNFKCKKTKNNDCLPLIKFLCTKNYCFCCLIFACFHFDIQFVLVLHFCIAEIFLQKVSVCPDSLIYCTTDVCHPQFPVKNLSFHRFFCLHLLIPICIHLFLSVRTNCQFSKHFFILMHLFLSVWISS